MENRSRNTIAGRAAILSNGNAGIPEQFSSTNSIASRAAVMKNNNAGIPKQPMKMPNQLPGQRNNQNYERQMAGGRAPVIPNNGNTGARQPELNIKVSPPPSKPTVERNMESPTRRPVSNFEETSVISAERLQEAIIWSEILGEPLSRRKRRYRS